MTAVSPDSTPTARGTTVRPGWWVALACGLLWVLVALVLMGWVFGMPTRTVHQSPDEAITSLATERVAEVGRPEIERFPDDGRLLHPRMWVPVGEHYVPAAAPGSLELYGALRAVPGGVVAIYAVPALGLGAWVAAVALLLPASGRWLALLLPGLAAPATYWLLRPFHNVALELAVVGLGVLAAVIGHGSGRRRWSVAVLVAAVVAALVRPDHVHVLLGAALLWGWWRHRDRLGAVLAAGGVAVAAWLAGNLAMNLHLTGDALTTPTSLLDFPDEVRGLPSSISGPIRLVLLILLPNLLPSASTLVTQVDKYWVRNGAVAVVVALAAVAVVVLWRRGTPRDRIALGVGVTGLVVFALSRISATDLGAASAVAQPVHSYPRYTAVAYLVVAVLALVTVGRASGWWRPAGMLVSMVAAVIGTVAVMTPAAAGEGLVWLRGQLHDADRFRDAVVAQLDDDTAIFSPHLDKYLAGQRTVGLLRPERTLPDDPPVFAPAVADAMEAAMGAGLTPVVLGVGDEVMGPLGAELTSRGLCVTPRPLALPEVEGVDVAAPAHVVGPCRLTGGRSRPS